MRIEDIEIHAGKPPFEYEPIRRLEAKCEASTAFAPAPTVEEMNGRLRTMAAKVGANAIIDVNYDSGVSMTSWKSMKGTGLAVRKISDERACPMCAETIKRAAIKCRHCGADVEPAPAPTVAAAAPAPGMPPGYRVVDVDEEPLRETNNPQMWAIVGVVIFVILTLIGIASSR
jgi:hypothetical protein